MLRVCRICGETLAPRKATATYCSDRCRREGNRRDNKVAEAERLWAGYRSVRPRGWKRRRVAL